MMSSRMTGWHMAWTLGAGAILTLVVACSGSTGRVGSSGDTGEGPAEDGGADGGDSASCTVTPLVGTRVCVPGTARAGAALSLEVDAKGCFGCGHSVLPCKVEVSGQRILLALEQKSCVTTELCPGVCQLPQTTCAIPPLKAGTYTVDFADAERQSDAPVRKLLVADGAVATSCDTGNPNEPPRPIVATDYPRACVGDGDCALITEGNVCAPCACANAAISKTALPTYEATVRERQALCNQGTGSASCVACEKRIAKCSAGMCVDEPAL
jgi:hypothetical protein